MPAICNFLPAVAKLYRFAFRTTSTNSVYAGWLPNTVRMLKLPAWMPISQFKWWAYMIKINRVMIARRFVWVRIPSVNQAPDAMMHWKQCLISSNKYFGSRVRFTGENRNPAQTAWRHTINCTTIGWSTCKVYIA